MADRNRYLANEIRDPADPAARRGGAAGLGVGEVILCIIQARMGSTRLPGKVLLPIGGKPILQWVIDAANNAELVDEVIVATSYKSEDAVLLEYCAEHQTYCELGPLDDVLERFYQAALWFQPLHIVRLTADCPMSDPYFIDNMIRHHLYGGFDYTTNSGFPGSFPDGTDVEVFTMDTLTRAAKLATKPEDREHVTPFMRQPNLFNIRQVPFPLLNGKIDPVTEKKYSVDTREDYERVKEEMERCLRGRRGYLTVH